MSRSELLRRVLEYGSIRPALNESSLFLQGEWEGEVSCDAVKSELERIFRRYPGLVSVKVLPSANKRLPPNTASSRGFVNFETPQQASRAVAAQRSCTVACGKEVKMMFSAKDINIKDAPDVRAMLTVVIRHCPPTIKLKDIEQKMQREFGEILRANMRPPRCATQDSEVIVQFLDKSAADAAVRSSQTRRFQVQNAILTFEKYATHEGEVNALRPGQIASYDGGSQATSQPTSQAGGVQQATDALADATLGAVDDPVPEPMPEPFPEPFPEPYPEAYPETDPEALLFSGAASHGGTTPAHMSHGSHGEVYQQGHASMGGDAPGFKSAAPPPQPQPPQPRAPVDSGPLHSVDTFHCPITHELFQDPVSAPDGRVYEHEAIKQWVGAHGCSPFTSQPMDCSALRPVPGLAEALQMLQWYAADRETMVQRLSQIRSLVNSPLQQGSNGAANGAAA